MVPVSRIRESIVQIVVRLGDRYIDPEDLLGERRV